MKTRKKSVKTKMPWYELDRMILSSFGSCDASLKPATLIALVEYDCRHREIVISRREIFARIEQMVEFGTLRPPRGIKIWQDIGLRPAPAE
jgi:hypothetical protein